MFSEILLAPPVGCVSRTSIKSPCRTGTIVGPVASKFPQARPGAGTDGRRHLGPDILTHMKPKGQSYIVAGWLLEVVVVYTITQVCLLTRML